LSLLLQPSSLAHGLFKSPPLRISSLPAAAATPPARRARSDAGIDQAQWVPPCPPLPLRVAWPVTPAAGTQMTPRRWPSSSSDGCKGRASSQSTRRARECAPSFRRQSTRTRRGDSALGEATIKTAAQFAARDPRSWLPERPSAAGAADGRISGESDGSMHTSFGRALHYLSRLWLLQPLYGLAERDALVVKASDPPVTGVAIVALAGECCLHSASSECMRLPGRLRAGGASSACSIERLSPLIDSSFSSGLSAPIYT